MEHTITEKLGTAGLVFALFCGCSASTALIRDPAMLVKDPGILVGHPKFEIKDLTVIRRFMGYLKLYTLIRIHQPKSNRKTKPYKF